MRLAGKVVIGSVVVAALGVGLTGPVPSASAAPPPVPSVVTFDDSSNVWLSTAGSAPTKLRDGSPDVFPGVSSDAGTTAAWFLGAALPQIAVAHNGAITATVDDLEDTRQILYDVSSDGSTFVASVPTAAGPWRTRIYDAVTGALRADQTFNSPFLDVWLSADGSALYLLLGTTPLSVYKCNGSGALTCPKYVSLSGIPAAAKPGAQPLWDHVSADGSTLAGVLDTGTASTAGHPQFDGWSVTGLPGSPLVTDAGAGLTGGVGRFVGNDLFVAEQGHVLSYGAPVAFSAATPTADTAMAMTGSPAAVKAPGSTYDGTFTAPTPMTTSTELLRLVNGSFIPQGSQTLAITTTLSLFPGTFATGWPYDYWDETVSHVQYSYDKVTWTDYPWFSSALGVRQNIWLKAVHDGEINATASSSAPILISARPVVTAGYKPATRTMYGAATVPDGTKVYVQRRISTNTWSTYATPLAKSKAYSVKLPAAHGQWRAVVLATSTYVQSISTTVVT
jgi:hypothetical protein